MVSRSWPHRGGLLAFYGSALALVLVGCGGQSPTFQEGSIASARPKQVQDADATATVVVREPMPAATDSVLKSLQEEAAAKRADSDQASADLEGNGVKGNGQASDAHAAGDGLGSNAAGGNKDDLASNYPGLSGSGSSASGSGSAGGQNSADASSGGGSAGSGTDSNSPSGSEGGLGLPGGSAGSGTGSGTGIGSNYPSGSEGGVGLPGGSGSSTPSDTASGGGSTPSDTASNGGSGSGSGGDAGNNGSTTPGGTGGSSGGSTGSGSTDTANNGGTGGTSGDAGAGGGGSTTTPGDDVVDNHGGSPDDSVPPGNENPIVIRDFTQDVVQKDAGKVDILWIVDSSGSMSEEQAYLGNNFNSFISGLAASELNFQTAITSTDICPNSMPSNKAERACPADYGGSSATRLRGSFVGDTGYKVLKQTTNDLVQRFNSYARVGINGSGFEHGLKAAEMAVAKSLSGANEGLVRSDAFLSVIVVSDEEDDGVGLSQTDYYTGYNFKDMGLTTYYYDENNLISYLNGTKGAGKFSISTITGVRGPDGKMCSSPHSQPMEEGATYIKAAKKTGGMIQSICETNWAASLYKIGQDLNAQITQVVLENPAIASSIKVFVNDTQVTGWSYIEGSNSIKFNAASVPAPGSQIHIAYKAIVD